MLTDYIEESIFNVRKIVVVKKNQRVYYDYPITNKKRVHSLTVKNITRAHK